MKRSPMSTIRALSNDDAIPDGSPRRYYNADGYVRLRWRIGPGRYVEAYEHRINAGRPHPRLHVHHINGVKDDNRPENLQVLTPEEHGLLHEERAQATDPMRGKRFGGHRSADAQARAQRRVTREEEMNERSGEMRALYADGLSTTEIGRLLGLHSSNVSRHLRSKGVLMRPRTVAAGESLLRRSTQVVHARSAMTCERCGQNTKWTGNNVHHRSPRQMGGSREDYINLPGNLLLLCPDCHSHVESHRTEAKEQGYLVARRDDPTTIPVLTYQGWRIYDNDGMTQMYEPEGAL